MSRTTRRTNRKPPIWVTHEYGDRNNNWVDILKDDKELAKSVAIWHSDANYKTGNYNQQTDPHHRAMAKLELERYKKNPEYEVQVRRKCYNDWY